MIIILNDQFFKSFKKIGNFHCEIIFFQIVIDCIPKGLAQWKFLCEIELSKYGRGPNDSVYIWYVE